MATTGDRDSAREQLRELERGETASWVVYPPTPVWWPASFGVWAATFAVAVGLLDGVPRSLAQLALVLLLLPALAWDRRRRGTYPSGRPPRELHAPILRMVVGAVAVAGLAWLTGVQVARWPAAAVAGIGAFVVIRLYEREYAAVAARIRERQA